MAEALVLDSQVFIDFGDDFGRLSQGEEMYVV
jgi:hypothetical protein